MPEFTDRQSKAMVERVKEAKLHGVEISSYTPFDHHWHGTFADEIRTGRGSDFNGIWCDGEKLLQVSLNVYGYGFMSIADVDWIHNNEDCECEVCMAQESHGSGSGGI